MTRVAVSVPVRPDEPTAREWLEQELAKPGYRHFSWPDLTFGDPSWSLPGGPWTLVVLAVVLAAVVILVYRGLPRTRHRRQDGTGAVFDGATGTSAELRARAGELAASGRWSAAVRELYRALIRGLQERTLLDERPGLTADEAAREAGVLLPSLTADLRASAVLFDRVVFGRRDATEDDYRRLLAVEEQVRRSRPVLAGAQPEPGLAVPR